MGQFSMEISGHAGSVLSGNQQHVIIERIKTGDHVQPHETRRLHKDGTEVHVSLRVSPIYDENGGIVGASKIARDISERKEAERQQNLLVGELTHRVKNVLATVNAIVRQTLGPAGPDSPAASLLSRLQSLAKAHDLLTESNWKSASLQDIVREALSPYPESMFEVAGDDVLVNARAVLSLSLVLHELGTNAAKYGALSSEAGRVRISWRTIESTDPEQTALKLRWEERGGPPVVMPSHKGFGSRLLQTVVTSELRGGVLVDYAPTGLIYDIEMAFSSLTG